MEQFLGEVATGAWNERFDAGRPLDEGIDDLVLLHPHLEDALRAWKTRWIEMIKGPIQGTVQILNELVERDVPIVALTNWSIETFPLVRHDLSYSFFEYFSKIYVSGELKMIKPDPQIFAHVEDDLNLAPQHLVFIDDNSANVAAAKVRGWQAHLFTVPSSLRSFLAKRGLLAASA